MLAFSVLVQLILNTFLSQRLCFLIIEIPAKSEKEKRGSVWHNCAHCLANVLTHTRKKKV